MLFLFQYPPPSYIWHYHAFFLVESHSEAIYFDDVKGIDLHTAMRKELAEMIILMELICISCLGERRELSILEDSFT